MPKPCDNCDDSDGWVTISVPCPVCRGDGKLPPSDAYNSLPEILEGIERAYSMIQRFRDYTPKGAGVTLPDVQNVLFRALYIAGVADGLKESDHA